MPVHATTQPENAASSVATSVTAISDQLQKRLDRERRLAAETRRVERLQHRQAMDAAWQALRHQSM